MTKGVEYGAAEYIASKVQKNVLNKTNGNDDIKPHLS